MGQVRLGHIAAGSADRRVGGPRSLPHPLPTSEVFNEPTELCPGSRNDMNPHLVRKGHVSDRHGNPVYLSGMRSPNKS